MEEDGDGGRKKGTKLKPMNQKKQQKQKQ